MNNYKFEKTSAAELANLKQHYLDQLPHPKDGMWEAFVSMADHYAIKINDEIIGYCVINDQLNLLQYHVAADQPTAEIFSKLLVDLKITGAMVATVEPSFLSLCMDHHQRITIHALMYHMQENAPFSAATFPEKSEFALLSSDDLDQAVRFAHETLGADQNWLTVYFGGLIARGELYGLWQDGALMATGECRVSDHQKPYADLGMIVGTAHRGQGLATNILLELLKQCRSRGLKPICSTESENIAAQKAITRAGFISEHRILAIEFQ